MNAPVSAALLQLRAAVAPRRMQPTVASDKRVLAVQYEHDGLYLDLHGTLDAAGYDVEVVTLTGDVRAITALFSRQQLREMSDWCDRMLPSAQALLLVSQQEARAERAMWARNCGATPP